MAGRPKKPISVLLADGKKNLTKAEIQERQEQEAQLQPATDNIKCPSWLDKEAKKEWKRIVSDLIELGIMTNIDTTSLALYCDAYSQYIKAAKSIQDDGLTIEYTNAGGSTNIVANPNIAIANKYAQQIKSFGSEFGLSPSARLKLVVPKTDDPKEKSEEERLFGDVV